MDNYSDAYDNFKNNSDQSQYGHIVENDREKYSTFLEYCVELWPFIDPETLVAPKRVWIILNYIAARFSYGENDEEEMHQLINESYHGLSLLKPDDLSKEIMDQLYKYLVALQMDVCYNMME